MQGGAKAPPFFFSGVPRMIARGVTTVELVIFMVIVAILAAVTVLSYKPNDVTARYQAERLRTDLRHAQMIALTENQALLFTITAGLGGSYSVSGLNSATCATTALTDPATNSAFAVSIDAALTLAGTASIYLDALGRPASSCSAVAGVCTCTTTASNPAASYTVSGGGSTYTVQLLPVSGFVTVTP